MYQRHEMDDITINVNEFEVDLTEYDVQIYCGIIF